jgi:hypothetical protein
MMRKIVTLLLLLVFLAASSIATFAPVKAESKTITVPDAYPTIQAAIDNASEGDTVFVKRGTYNVGIGGLFIDKPISLIGEDSQATTIINSYNRDDFSNEYVILVDASDVKISGFTITSNPYRSLTGILLQDDNSDKGVSGCAITGNNIVNNQQGVWVSDGIYDVTQVKPKPLNLISKNNITGNLEYGLIIFSSYTTISENQIADNYFGILAHLCSNVNITENQISSNVYGIELEWWGPFYVYENNITDATTGYGIQFRGCSNSTVYKNNILSNGIGVNLVNHQLVTNSTTGGLGNKVYDNNIINNTQNAFVQHDFEFNINVHENGTDVVSWDNGVVGNYWSGYDGHGFYVIDENNIDHHPLTQQVNISTTAPELSTIIVAIAIIIIVVVASIGLLVYFKKRQH